MIERAVKQIMLASRPKGLRTRENFRLEEVPMPSCRKAAFCCGRWGVALGLMWSSKFTTASCK
jgi:hypothetical protein